MAGNRQHQASVRSPSDVKVHLLDCDRVRRAGKEGRRERRDQARDKDQSGCCLSSTPPTDTDTQNPTDLLIYYSSRKWKSQPGARSGGDGRAA